MTFEDWQAENTMQTGDGFTTWQQQNQRVDEVHPLAELGTAYGGQSFATPEELEIAKPVKEVGKAIARMPERTAGQIGHLMEWAADYEPEKSILPPERLLGKLWNRIQPQWHKTMEEANRRMIRKYGEQTSAYWRKAAETGWEAPSQEYLESTWKSAPVTKALAGAAENSGSFLGAIATSYITKSPQLGIFMLSGLAGGSAYKVQKEKGVDKEIAQNVALLTAAWEGLTEQIPFDAIFNQTSKNALRKFLKVGTLEGFQEFIQGIGENFFEHFGYNFKKDWKSIPTAAKEGVAHALDNWLDNVTAGFIMGGAAGAGVHALTQQNIKKKLIPPEATQMEQLQNTNKTTQIIEDSKELTSEEKEEGLRYIGDIQTEVINKIIERFPGEVNDQKSLEKIGNEIKDYLGIKQKVDWVWDERPTTRNLGFHKGSDKYGHEITVRGNYYLGSNEQRKRTIVHELGHIAEPSRRTKAFKRSVHHKQFKQWLEKNIKILSEQKQITEPIHSEEAIGPIGQQQVEKPTIEQMVAPKPFSRKKLLNLGHKIAKKAKWSDMQRRDFMESITGKRSMKEMSKDEMQSYVDALIKETGIEPTSPKQKGDEPVALGNRITTMNDIMEQAGKQIQDLPNVVDIPEVIKRNFIRKKRGGFLRKAKHLFFGIDNSPLYQLANNLEMGKPGIFTEVFDTNIQKARKTEAGHKRSVQTLLDQTFEEAGITPQDLAEISNSVNPRATWYQFLQEKTGEGTKIHSVKLNNKTFEMNLGELLDVYLISQQKQGMAHLQGGGLIINGVETGPIIDTDIARLQTYIDTNPKVKAIADAFTAIQENIWKPSLNQTAVTLGEEPIATVDKWWGFEVYYPKQLPGKEQKFNVNLIENKSIFKQRTNSERPLVTRDAFQRFMTFENAIAEYIAFAQPLRIARTVINDPDLAAEIDKKGYKDVQNNMRTILDRTQSLQRPQGKPEALIAKVLPGVYRAVLFFNPRVIMSQFTSVTNYAAFVSPKYINNLTKGISNQSIQETLDLSDIAWDRFYMGHSSYELGELGAADAVLKFFTKNSADINKLGISLKVADMAALSSGLEIAKTEYSDAQNDSIVGDSATWWANKNTSFKEGSEGWKQAVTERAEWLWQRSQPSWDKWNRSMLTSDPSAVRRIFFLFRSFHEKSLAILQSASTEYEGSNKTLEDKAQFAKKYGAVLSGYTLNTMLRALIMVGLLREVKEPFEYLSDIITAPFSMLPILGKALQTTIRNFVNVLNESAPEYRGEAVESLPVKIINTIAKAPDNFARAVGYYLNGEDEKAEKALRKAVGSAYEGVGTAYGVPTSEIKRGYSGWVEEEETGRTRTRRTRSR